MEPVAEDFQNYLLEDCLCYDEVTGEWCMDLVKQCYGYIEMFNVVGLPGWFGFGLIFSGLLLFYLVRLFNYLYLKDKNPEKEKVFTRRQHYLTRVTYAICIPIVIAMTIVSTIFFEVGWVSVGDAVDTASNTNSEVLHAAVVFANAITNVAAVVPIEPKEYFAADTLDNWNSDFADILHLYDLKSWYVHGPMWAMALFFTANYFAMSNNMRKTALTTLPFIGLIGMSLALYVVVMSSIWYITSTVCTDYVPIVESVANIVTLRIAPAAENVQYFMSNASEMAVEALCDETTGNITTLCDSYFTCEIECDTFIDTVRIIQSESILYDEDARGDCDGLCSISRCATLCLNTSAAYNISQGAVHTVSTITTSLSSIVSSVNIVTNGTVYTELLYGVKHNICTDWYTSSIVSSITTGVTLIAFCIGTVVAAYNTKRQPYQHRSVIEDGEEIMLRTQPTLKYS